MANQPLLRNWPR